MYPAINAWTFAIDMPPLAQLASAAGAGFAGIELIAADSAAVGGAGASPDTRAVPLDAPREFRRELAAEARARNLRITGLTGAMFWQTNFASPAVADRARARDTTIRMLDLAADIGAEAIVLVPAVVGRATDPRGQVAYADALNRSYDALVPLAREGQLRGVMICIENVWNRFLLSPVELQEFIDRVNSPFVRVCFDTGNVLAFGYPQDWIETLGGRIARVHAKDFDVSKPGRAGFCALGEGSVDWPAVMGALQRAGYDGPLIFEGAADPAEACRKLRVLMDAGSAARPT